MSDDRYSRKGFFQEFFGLFKTGLSNNLEKKLAKTLNAPVRPPGAMEEMEFISTCTRCGDCVPACPYGAILRYPLTAGLRGGTPYIDPHTKACELCPDTPCITACKPGALEPTPVDRIDMGTAKVNPETCMTFDNKICTRCYDACPYPERAIVIEDHHPRVNENGCVGCGLCQERCPTHPVGIKVLSPLQYRAVKNDEELYFGLFAVEEEDR